MACTHEFGIIDDIDYRKGYSDYNPQKYNCISVDDDVINRLISNLSIMKTYSHSFNKPDYSLNHWGVTIIPPESLPIFYEVVASSTQPERIEELNELATLIRTAIEEEKYMIHYGV